MISSILIDRKEVQISKEQKVLLCTYFSPVRRDQTMVSAKGNSTA